MRRDRLLATIVTLCCIVPAAALSSSGDSPTGRAQVVVRSGAYSIVPEGKAQKIVMEGFGYLSEPGKPMLPERTVLIGLPPGALVQSIEARGLAGTLLPGVHRIAPAPPILPLAEPARCRELMAEMQREWRENNTAAYSTDAPYPKKIGRMIGSGSLRKYAYVSVSLCPFSYRPLSGRLTHFDAVEVTVRYSTPAEGTQRAREIENLMADRAADRRASELFVNYDQVADLYRPTQPLERVESETWDYVIITTGALAGAVSSSEFAAWKSSVGHNMRTVLTSDPEISGQPGADLAERIRNFLRSYYGPWEIRYVLIVGDYATVPMRYCYPNPDDHTHNPSDYQNAGGSVPTDYYYADLSLPDATSWDLDGDGYPGEYLQDSPDFLAEVYVGRIPTSDTGRITYTLDKLVGFERDRGLWKNRALQPGSILFFENQNHSGYPKVDGCVLLNQIETNIMTGWTASHYSEQEGLSVSGFSWPPVSLSAFIDDWRTGSYGVVNWSGHGAPYGVVRTVWDWDDGDGVPETDGSDGISNPLMIDQYCSLDDDHPSIVFAVSCNVGYPEPNGVGNLGIDLLTKPGFGAAAGIVSSSRPAAVSTDVVSSPGGAESICYEFNRHEISLNEPLGEALYDAKFYCYLNYGWDHYYEYMNQFNFDLYGDPSLMRAGITAPNDVPATFAHAAALGVALIVLSALLLLRRQRRGSRTA